MKLKKTNTTSSKPISKKRKSPVQEKYEQEQQANKVESADQANTDKVNKFMIQLHDVPTSDNMSGLYRWVIEGKLRESDSLQMLNAGKDPAKLMLLQMVRDGEPCQF